MMRKSLYPKAGATFLLISTAGICATCTILLVVVGLASGLVSVSPMDVAVLFVVGVGLAVGVGVVVDVAVLLATGTGAATGDVGAAAGVATGLATTGAGVGAAAIGAGAATGFAAGLVGKLKAVTCCLPILNMLEVLPPKAEKLMGLAFVFFAATVLALALVFGDDLLISLPRLAACAVAVLMPLLGLLFVPNPIKLALKSVVVLVVLVFAGTSQSSFDCKALIISSREALVNPSTGGLSEYCVLPLASRHL